MLSCPRLNVVDGAQPLHAALVVDKEDEWCSRLCTLVRWASRSAQACRRSAVPRACFWSRAQCEASQQKPIARRIDFYIKPDLDGLNPDLDGLNPEVEEFVSNIAHNFANIVRDEDYVMGAMNPAAAGRPSRHRPSPLTGAAATDECALSIARRTKVHRRLELAGQWRASHSLCVGGTTRSAPPGTSSVGIVMVAGSKPHGEPYGARLASRPRRLHDRGVALRRHVRVAHRWSGPRQRDDRWRGGRPRSRRARRPTRGCGPAEVSSLQSRAGRTTPSECRVGSTPRTAAQAAHRCWACRDARTR